MQPYVDQYYFKVKPGMQGALGMEQDAVGKYSDPRNARLMQVESKVQALAGLVAHNPKLDMGYRPEDAWDASARDLAYKDHRNVRTVRAEAEGEYAQKLRQLYQDNDRRLQELGGNYPRAGSAVIGALGGAGIGALIQYLRGQDAMGGALAGAGIGGLGGAFTPELSNILGMGNQNEDQ
jgi:hypothetical protein